MRVVRICHQWILVHDAQVDFGEDGWLKMPTLLDAVLEHGKIRFHRRRIGHIDAVVGVQPFMLRAQHHHT